MKKIFSILFISSLAIAFASCEKNDPRPEYFISAKVGGELKTYHADAIALKVKVDTVYSITMNAKAAAGSPEQFFLTVLSASNPITNGTYIDQGEAYDKLLVAGGYNPGTTDDSKVYAAGLQQDNNPRLTINLTFTETTASGTFSGTFYDHGGDGPAIIAVTEGKFNLPLVQ